MYVCTYISHLQRFKVRITDEMCAYQCFIRGGGTLGMVLPEKLTQPSFCEYMYTFLWHVGICTYVRIYG